MSQPAVVLKGLPEHRVFLLGSTSPEFSAALPPSRAPEGDVLLPYVVLLSNESNKNISAWSIRWALRDGNGGEIFHSVVNWNFDTYKPADGLPSRSGRLMTIVQGLGDPNMPADDNFRTSVDRYLKIYERQREIVISLDAVLFEDGQALGPDLDGWIPRFKARIDAERDLLEELTSTVKGESSSARSAGIAKASAAFLAARDKALRRLSRRPDEDFRILDVEANRAPDYENSYTLIKGYMSGMLLTSLSNDPDNTLKEAALVRSTRTYPNVRREFQ